MELPWDFKKNLHISSRPFKASADVTRVTMSWPENDIFQLEDIRQIWIRCPGLKKNMKLLVSTT